MGQQKKSSHQSKESEYPDRLHPSLRANFIPLPETNASLTDEQLAAIFGGDLDALRDLVRLAHQQIQEQKGTMR